MKIVVGYDGSDSANAALADMRRAGLTRQAEAMVVSISGEPLLPAPPPSVYELLDKRIDDDVVLTAAPQLNEETVFVERARELAFTGTEYVRSFFPRWNVRAESLLGSPAPRLIQKASEWKADLVVVGARRRRLLERLVTDSVSEKVVTEAACSVRVGRLRSPRGGSPITLVVGVDGSPNSQAAVREIARREWPKGTRTRVVAATNEAAQAVAARAANSVWPDLRAEFTVDRPVIAEANADAAAEELYLAGLHVTTIVKQQDPQLALIEEAQSSAADCIFVGATRFGWLKRLLARSVSLLVAMRAPCSVEIVRPLAAERRLCA
jgi:nucleotide-binding universal stress UspA family protein